MRATAKVFTFLVIIIFTNSLNVFAQPVHTDKRPIETLGSFCEDVTFQIGRANYISCFHSKSGKCNSTIEYSVTDASQNIQVDGVGYISSSVLFPYKADGIHDINNMLFSFKAVKDTEITITTRSLVEIDVPEGCNSPERTYIAETIWTYRVIVIPKPPIPRLSVEKYISTSTVNLIASGCPTDQPGYDYQWNAKLCDTDVNEKFSIGDKDGTYGGFGDFSYRVLCSADYGHCLSKPSDPEKGLVYDAPNMSDIPEKYRKQIQRIEDIRKSPRPDYHHYPVETAICDISDPNCSVRSVYNILLSGNQFIAATTDDMRGFGSINQMTSFDNTAPVESYATVLLSGPIVRLAEQGALEATARFLANPIMTYIDNRHYSVMNYTLPGHVLSPGRVIRSVIQKCDKVYVVTIGEGVTEQGDVPMDECASCPAIAILKSLVNTSEGKNLFEKVDARVKNEYKRRYP